MAHEVVELVRARYEAMNQVVAEGGDLDAFIRASYDRDIVMEMGALEGTIQGLDGVKRFIEGQAAIIKGLRSEPEEIIDAGERIVVAFRLSGRARSTGLPFEVHYAHVLKLRDGKLVHIRLYTSMSKAMRAAGLSP